MAGLLLIAGFFVVQSMPSADAQAGQPSLDDTSRLLGYLWGDAVNENGVWNMDRASGSNELFQTLVIRHGGTWVDRRQLEFTLPAPYDWEGWNTSVPNDDARTRAAVRRPNFLAAVLEGEGEIDGHIYDQDSCCRPFLEGRLVGMRDLLLELGFETAEITKSRDVHSGKVVIDSSEIAELRRGHQFVCPFVPGEIRVPGAEEYDRFGPIRWFGPDDDYAPFVRTDCAEGTPVTDFDPSTGACTVTSEGAGRLRVSWSFKHGNIAVRRNDKFMVALASIDRFFVDAPSPGTHSYVVRLSFDGKRADVACGDGSTATPAQTPPPPGATCLDQIITIFGTGGNDIIDGTPGVDVIHGFAGDDLIRGFGKNDVICGGDGNDRIRGGYGNDMISGGGGNDRIDAGPGADEARGGFGNDIIYGRRGLDTLYGDAGNDILRAGNGFDTLFGGRGIDVLRGGPHVDTCTGGWGADTISADCETAIQ